jgi:hypothetical protein
LDLSVVLSMGLCVYEQNIIHILSSCRIPNGSLKVTSNIFFLLAYFPFLCTWYEVNFVQLSTAVNPYKALASTLPGLDK